jgi:DNA-binding MarR family transcriptional regulator
MSDRVQDTNRLQELVFSFGRTMKPRLWSAIIAHSGVSIDRPAAGILYMLLKSESGCNPRLLAKQAGVEAPFVSRKIQELKEAGLVERKTDESDRRSFNIKLTKLGQEVAELLQSAKSSAFKDILRDWSTADLEELIKLLNQLMEDTNKFSDRAKQTVIQNREL